MARYALVRLGAADLPLGDRVGDRREPGSRASSSWDRTSAQDVGAAGHTCSAWASACSYALRLAASDVRFAWSPVTMYARRSEAARTTESRIWLFARCSGSSAAATSRSAPDDERLSSSPPTPEPTTTRPTTANPASSRRRMLHEGVATSVLAAHEPTRSAAGRLGRSGLAAWVKPTRVITPHSYPLPRSSSHSPCSRQYAVICR